MHGWWIWRWQPATERLDDTGEFVCQQDMTAMTWFKLQPLAKPCAKMTTENCSQNKHAACPDVWLSCAEGKRCIIQNNFGEDQAMVPLNLRWKHNVTEKVVWPALCAGLHALSHSPMATRPMPGRVSDRSTPSQECVSVVSSSNMLTTPALDCPAKVHSCGMTLNTTPSQRHMLLKKRPSVPSTAWKMSSPGSV